MKCEIVADQDTVVALAQSVDGGVFLGDKAYRAEELASLCEEVAEVMLLTPQSGTASQRSLLCTLRERIETTFSQLAERFIDRVRSRSFTGLWNTIKLKMLHFSFCKAGIIQN